MLKKLKENLIFKDLNIELIEIKPNIHIANINKKKYIIKTIYISEYDFKKRLEFINKLIINKIKTPKIINKFSIEISKNKFILTQKISRNKKIEISKENIKKY